MVDLKKCLIRCNKAFCNFLAYTEKELIGKTIADFTHPDDRELGMANMKRLAQGKQESAFVQKRYIRKDGRVVWGELTISLVRDENNKPLYLLAVIQDITERYNAKKALIKSEKQLKELNATKDKLFSVIAHDLRSPFNNILGFSELILGNIQDLKVTEIEKYVGFINLSAVNTLHLLDNLLNWVKSQTKQTIYNPQNIELSSVIKRVIELSTVTATIKTITIAQQQAENITVYTDEEMLNVVLRNLISNAIKFTQPGGNISVMVVKKQNQVEITISDNGIGINKATLKKLFHISENITSRGTANEKGSGFGLVLCKEFVEKLGGTIWVESKEGKGSDFKFTLPCNTNQTTSNKI